VRVLIVGAGAVGSLLGWALADAGESVTLVRRASPPGAAASASHGTIEIRRPDGSRSAVGVGVVAGVDAAAHAGDPPEVVLVAVRQHDLAGVMRDLAAIPDAVVVTVQNGIGAEDAAASVRPGGALLGASLTAAVELDGSGTVGWLRRGGIGLASVAAFRPAGPVASGSTLPSDQASIERSAAVGHRLASAFEGSGLPSRWFDDVRAMKWSKLIANLVGNATSALLDMDPAAIYRDPGLFAVERDQLREALGVMAALGLAVVDLPGAPVTWLARAVRLPDPLASFALRRVVGGARGGKDPSLRIVLSEGGPTEVAWLNGAVARAAAESGRQAPVNAALARLVDEAASDATRRAWFVHQPERLMDAIRAS
jgi:2-dehydropantoate 2-reductase